MLLLRTEQYSVGYTSVARKGFVAGSWLSLWTRGAGDLRGVTVGGIMVVVLVEVSSSLCCQVGGCDKCVIFVQDYCCTVLLLSRVYKDFSQDMFSGCLHACLFRAFFKGRPLLLTNTPGWLNLLVDFFFFSLALL